jgi:hypothetical protein
MNITIRTAIFAAVSQFRGIDVSGDNEARIDGGYGWRIKA